ncbi:MAG TPA: peptidoglycan-associated lipoprotein Pal [Terracidiphilus sp.]
MNRVHRILTPLVLLVALAAVAGCGNKKAQTDLSAAETAPAAAPAAPPTAQITATPTLITAGDQVQLSWRTSDANKVTIDGIGDVPTSGVKTVTPTTSTVYTLTARGDGGSIDASVRVTVNAVAAAPPAVVVPTRSLTAEEEFKGGIQDIFFDYDTYDIRPDAQAALSKDVAYLVNHPDAKIVIGGYCDERGSNEYNLALGQNRADATKNALVTAGVSASRIRVVSYGKEKPFCSESTEECWQQNRRGGFVIDK